MRTRSFLAAFGLLALLFGFAYDVWAEAGLYGWFAAMLLTITGAVGSKVTFVLTLLAYLVPGFFLGRFVKGLPRWATSVCLGIPAIGVATHFALTISYMTTGGPTIPAMSFHEQVAAAGYLPRNIVTPLANLPRLDFDHAVSIGRAGSNDPDKIYIPFAPDRANPIGMPVLLETRRALLQSERDTLSGSIRRSPVPYLVRRANTESAAAFAIIIADDESVRGYWLLPAIFYGFVLGWVAYRLTRRRAATPPANAQDPAPPPRGPVLRS